MSLGKLCLREASGAFQPLHHGLSLWSISFSPASCARCAHTAGLWVPLRPSASPDILESLEGGGWCYVLGQWYSRVKGFALLAAQLDRTLSGCNSLDIVLCRWVQEFLNEENRGLDVLLEYLAFAQCSVT